MSGRKEWMLGIPGHNELVNLDAVLLLLRGGQLRPTDLVKKLGEPWRAANEVVELAPHFSSNPPPLAARAVAEPPPAKTPDVRPGEPIRSTTDRVPRALSKPPDSSKTISKVDSRGEPAAPPKPARPVDEKAPEAAAPEAAKPPEEKGPIRSSTGRVNTIGSTTRADPKPAPAAPAPVAPPKDEKKEEKKEERKEEKKDDRRESRNEADKTDKISGRSARKRELPKPPPKVEPKIEPMVGKYYSPVDMLRSASFAFEPKKLLYSSPVAFLVIIWSIGMYRSGGASGGGVFEGMLFILFTAILVFGLSFLLTGLAFISRRQCEGRDYYLGEVVHYTVQTAATALVYPVIALVPSLASLGILFLLGLARNRNPGMASTLKIGFILPMIFAFVTVLGALVYQIASMYVPAAAAIEGEGLSGSVRQAWSYVRRQWGRVVLHWLIVTVAFGVISIVCLGLSHYAILLPDTIFGKPDESIMTAWNQFDGLMAVYKGLAYGLGMILPVSLLSTLGTLSYLSLRHPAGAQLSPSPMDDTSGIAIGAMRGSHAPGESTNPSDTRPAPAEASPPLSDISDDSDEQPLVKD